MEIYVIHGNITTLQILCQYHIVFIQEIQPSMRPIRDQKGKVTYHPMGDFVSELNKFILQT